MPELIDKAKVLKYLTPRIKTKTPYGEGYNKALEDAAELVVLMPTIEPEVRHGWWIQSDALDYKDPNGVIHVHGMCSCCRLIYDFRDMTSRFKFCPNCGARMDGGGLTNAHQSKQNPND